MLYIPGSGTPQTYGPARVCILGDSGVGKTRLAATFPNPYFLDLENGAGSTGKPRLFVPPSANTSATVLNEIKALAGLAVIDGAVKHPKKGFPISTLVLDSIDGIQETEKYFGVLKGRTKMQMQDWDTLYNVIFPLVLAWSSLPIHVVVVAHVKQEEGEEGKPGVKSFSLQGSFKDKMPRWFDYILHLAAGPDGKRFVITQPMISKGYQYKAKDRHGVLAALAKGGYIELPLTEKGFPTSEISDTISKAHILVSE
jgi:hypothetical protein